MSDSQWPRYQVFQQDRPDQPHRAVGTVHAVDGEMALLNARDVYARRPRWLSAWVVADDRIFRKTAEELEADGSWRQAPHGKEESYLVFQKRSQRRSMTFTDHVGDVTARSPQEALSRAIDQFDDAGVTVWWVVAAAALTRSEPDDVASWFDPIKDKTYRQQSQYGSVTPTPRTGRLDTGETP
jgi:ring-1,2-phenylacetyl-CoA epoxidase subunit PaaB